MNRIPSLVSSTVLFAALSALAQLGCEQSTRPATDATAPPPPPPPGEAAPSEGTPPPRGPWGERPPGAAPAPPPEASAACTGKAAGASCSFNHGERSIAGTCAAPPGQSELSCLPPMPQGKPVGAPHAPSS